DGLRRIAARRTVFRSKNRNIEFRIVIDSGEIGVSVKLPLDGVPHVAHVGLGRIRWNLKHHGNEAAGRPRFDLTRFKRPLFLPLNSFVNTVTVTGLGDGSMNTREF